MKVFRQNRRKQTDPGVKVERKSAAGIPGNDRNHFVDQMTVHLEKGSGADLIVAFVGPIKDLFCSRLCQWLRVRWGVILFAAAARREKRDTDNFPNLALE